MATRPGVEADTEQALLKGMAVIDDRLPELKLDFAVGQSAITPDHQKAIAKFVAAAKKLEAAAKAAGLSDWHVKLRVDGSADFSGNPNPQRDMELAQARSQNGTRAIAEALKAGGVSAIQVEQGSASIGTKDRSTRIALGRTVNDAEPDFNLATASAATFAAAYATPRTFAANAAVPPAARGPDIAALRRIDILDAMRKHGITTPDDIPRLRAPLATSSKDSSAEQRAPAAQSYTIGI